MSHSTNYNNISNIDNYNPVVSSLTLCQIREIPRVHTAPVNWLSIDKIDYRYLLSTGADKQIHLYDLVPSDASTNKSAIKPLSTIPPEKSHEYGISGIEFYTLDTGMFTTCSYDNTIRVWDTNALESVCTFDIGAKVYNHALSPIGGHTLIADPNGISIHVAASSMAMIKLCDLRSGTSTQVLSGHKGGAMAVVWSPSQEYVLASGGADGTLKLWDVRRASSLLKCLDSGNKPGGDIRSEANHAHHGIINGLMYNEDGNDIISAGHDQMLRVWDAATGENKKIDFGNSIRNSQHQTVQMATQPFTTDSNTSSTIFFPNGDNTILALDCNSGELVNSLRGSMRRQNCTAWRCGKQELFSGGHDCEVLIWRPSTMEKLTDAQVQIRQDQWSDYSDDENPNYNKKKKRVWRGRR